MTDIETSTDPVDLIGLWRDGWITEVHDRQIIARLRLLLGTDPAQPVLDGLKTERWLCAESRLDLPLAALDKIWGELDVARNATDAALAAARLWPPRLARPERGRAFSRGRDTEGGHPPAEAPA